MANPKPTPLSFNIAARLIGDMRQDDALDQFLHSLERVKTDDCTESILVNAVKDMLHDPKPPGFAFNRISSPEGSFVRVDATIWIGMPEAPMGWDDIGLLNDGWHPSQRWGTLKHVGHPAVTPGSLLPSIAEEGQQPKRKRQRGVKSGAEGPQRKRKRTSDYNQGQEEDEAAIKTEQKDSEGPEKFLPVLSSVDTAISHEDIPPSSMIDLSLFHGGNDTLFEGLSV